MDNKISFIAGWALTTATTVTGMGLIRAALIGLVGGFFGLLGKQLYYQTRDWAVKSAPKAKSWVASKVKWVKDKLNVKSKG
jgi:uncharacterized membrane-anchored protein